MPWLPVPISQSTCGATSLRSISPSLANGVVIGGITPVGRTFMGSPPVVRCFVRPVRAKTTGCRGCDPVGALRPCRTDLKAQAQRPSHFAQNLGAGAIVAPIAERLIGKKKNETGERCAGQEFHPVHSWVVLTIPSEAMSRRSCRSYSAAKAINF